MFERFTEQARGVVIGAQLEARRLGSEQIGTEHLLLGLVHPPTASAPVLAQFGLTPESVATAVRRRAGGVQLDADALSAVGIDLDAIRDRVESQFGAGALDEPDTGRARGGHIPFARPAKKVLELALREAMTAGSRRITDRHVALGLIRSGNGVAAEVLRDLAVDTTRLDAALRSVTS